jgi:lipopolysaccharide core galacturonosyltransferase RgtB
MPETISAPASTIGIDETSFLPSPKQFFSLLLIYFGLHLIFRTLISESAGIDEAYQLTSGQELAWGYGPHAPLYTWLMLFFFKVFGSSEFSLALLRELLLLSSYTLTYFAARELTRSHVCGILAALALQFHPSLVWESQRELTNSIVASTMVLATLLSFLRIRPGGLGAWIAFGFFGGLTALSKYNAAIFYGAMLIAAMTIPELRSRMLNWRLALALLVTVAVIAPNAIWAYAHRDLTLSLTYKFGIHQRMPWFQSVTVGLKNWVVAVAAHVAPVVAVFAIILWRPIFFERCLKLRSAEEKFLWRTFLIVFGIGIVVVLFKVTEFKDRWLQPLFVAAPILVVVAVRAGLNRARLNVLIFVAATVSWVVVILAPGRLFLTEWRNRRDILNAPFRNFAADLTPYAENADFILSGNYWVGGNLRLWFPDKHIFSPDLAPPDLKYPGKSCLMVWNIERATPPPEELIEFARSFAGEGVNLTPTFIDEKWKYHQYKTMRLGVVFLHRKDSLQPTVGNN